MSCLASFVRLPSDLTPYSGCAELPIGDVLMIRVIRQKNGTTVHALYTLLTRKGSGDAVSPDQRDNDQPQYDRLRSRVHLNWTPPPSSTQFLQQLNAVFFMCCRIELSWGEGV